MNENLFPIKDGSCREKGTIAERILAIPHINGLTSVTSVMKKQLNLQQAESTKCTGHLEDDRQGWKKESFRASVLVPSNEIRVSVGAGGFTNISSTSHEESTLPDTLRVQERIRYGAGRPENFQ